MDNPGFLGPTPKIKSMTETNLRFIPVEGLRVTCIGAGYVGGPTMAMLALKNPSVRVTVVDSWKERVDAWNSDDLPVFEPGLLEIIKTVRGRNLFFVCERIEDVLRDSDIIFVSVNTPTKSFGLGKGVASNVKNIELAGRMIAAACTARPTIIVEKSTVPVRTAETLRRVLDANAKPGIKHSILSNPEFLAEVRRSAKMGREMQLTRARVHPSPVSRSLHDRTTPPKARS